MNKDEARELFDGMPCSEWKLNYQKEATAEQKADFKVAFRENVGKAGD